MEELWLSSCLFRAAASQRSVGGCGLAAFFLELRFSSCLFGTAVFQLSVWSCGVPAILCGGRGSPASVRGCGFPAIL
jgi:hypothetical protein